MRSPLWRMHHCRYDHPKNAPRRKPQLPCTQEAHFLYSVILSVNQEPRTSDWKGERFPDGRPNFPTRSSPAPSTSPSKTSGLPPRAQIAFLRAS